MSASFALSGSFGTPEAVNYRLYLDGIIGSTEYYSGFLDYIQIAFTWNPKTRIADIKSGRICWASLVSSNNPNNLENGVNDKGQIACFECKRYEQYISVSEAMNAILSPNVAASIHMSKFNDEELKIYRANAWQREERLYDQTMSNITLPENLSDSEKSAWIAEYHSEIVELRGRIETLFLFSQSTDGKHPGDYYFALDSTLYGPYYNKDAMDVEINQKTAKKLPAVPCCAYIAKDGSWRCCSEDEILGSKQVSS